MTTDRYIWGLSENTSEALGKIVRLVKVDNVEVIDAYTLRIYFNNYMKKNNNLVDILNYSIFVLSAGGVTPYIIRVELPDVSNPAYIDLITSEMTGGLNYEIEVSTTGPTDINDLHIDEYYNSKSFISIGINPTIKQVKAISNTRVDVIFSENMMYNGALSDVSKYTFDNGLSAISILEICGDTVKLVTTEQLSNVVYTLTVSP